MYCSVPERMTTDARQLHVRGARRSAPLKAAGKGCAAMTGYDDGGGGRERAHVGHFVNFFLYLSILYLSGVKVKCFLAP